VNRLYGELAEWWPILSDPADYKEEADLAYQLLRDCCQGELRTVLELGSGGGNLASHLKQHVLLTLSDLSPAMVAVSRGLNPECEHIVGDMRSLRLDRTFDAVLVHDAISYMTTEDDLARALDTCALHCRSGGALLLLPDFVRETYWSDTEHGGHDGAARSLRYLSWTWDPDPNDDTYITDYVYVLRDANGNVSVVHDRHTEGLFSRAVWERLLEDRGFTTRIVRDQWGRDLFASTKSRD
jgi:SAM-dependent methyltransferase